MPYTLVPGRAQAAPAARARGGAASLCSPPALRPCWPGRERRDAARRGDRAGAGAAAAAATGRRHGAAGRRRDRAVAARGAARRHAGDPVALRFKHPPRAGLLFDLDTGRVLWRHEPDARAADRVADEDDDRARGHRPRAAGRARCRSPRRRCTTRARASACCRAGKWIGVETMLYGLLLPSGNDAAIALAQRAGGTVPRLRRADERARRGDGPACTRYSSPSGFATAATTRARPTSPRSPARCCASRAWRGSSAAARPCCRSRSRAASSTSTTTTRCCGTGYPGTTGDQDRLHRRRRAAASSPPCGAAAAASASCCCTRPTRAARRGAAGPRVPRPGAA